MKVKHNVKPDDIALMQAHKGWWLKVGEDWYCLYDVIGREPTGKKLNSSQDKYAATKANFYKPLVDILKEIPIDISSSS